MSSITNSGINSGISNYSKSDISKVQDEQLRSENASNREFVISGTSKEVQVSKSNKYYMIMKISIISCVIIFCIYLLTSTIGKKKVNYEPNEYKNLNNLHTKGDFITKPSATPGESKDKQKCDKYSSSWLMDTIRSTPLHYDIWLDFSAGQTNSYTGEVGINLVAKRNKSIITILNKGQDISKVSVLEGGKQLNVREFITCDVLKITFIYMENTMAINQKYSVILNFQGSIFINDNSNVTYGYYFNRQDEVVQNGVADIFPYIYSPSSLVTFNLTMNHPTDQHPVFNTPTSSVEKHAEHSVTRFEPTPPLPLETLQIWLVKSRAQRKAHNLNVYRKLENQNTTIHKVNVDYYVTGSLKDLQLNQEHIQNMIDNVSHWYGLQEKQHSGYPFELISILETPYTTPLISNGYGVILIHPLTSAPKNQLHLKDYIIDNTLFMLPYTPHENFLSSIPMRNNDIGYLDIFRSLANDNKLKWPISKSRLMSRDAMDTDYTTNHKYLSNSILLVNVSHLNAERIATQVLAKSDKGVAVLKMYKKFPSNDTTMKTYVDSVLDFSLTGSTKSGNALNNKHADNTLDALRAWMEQPNYPVVRVEACSTKNTLTLTQHGFHLPGAERSSDWKLLKYQLKITEGEFDVNTVVSNDHSVVNLWNIPFTYKSSNSSLINLTYLRNKTTSLTFNHDSANWVIANVDGHGYYRVVYDNSTLDKITAAILVNQSAVSTLDRFNLIDDAFELAKTDLLDLSSAMDLSVFMTNEQSNIVWKVFLEKMDFLRLKIDSIEDLRLLNEFVDFKLYDKVNWRKNKNLTDIEYSFLLANIIYSEDGRLYNNVLRSFRDVDLKDISASSYNDVTKEILYNIYIKKAEDRTINDLVNTVIKDNYKNKPAIRSLAMFADGDICTRLLNGVYRTRSDLLIELMNNMATNRGAVQPLWQFFKENWMNFKFTKEEERQAHTTVARKRITYIQTNKIQLVSEQISNSIFSDRFKIASFMEIAKLCTRNIFKKAEVAEVMDFFGLNSFTSRDYIIPNEIKVMLETNLAWHRENYVQLIQYLSLSN